MKFGILGDGYIAQYHKQAIVELGGIIEKIYDPKMEDEYSKRQFERYQDSWFQNLDCVVICSPSNFHRYHTELALKNNINKIVVEKPAVLPWEPIVLDNRINIVLQLRWMSELKGFNPKQIICEAVRDEKYFQSWKGNPWNTGGIFFNIFIHYIDLAMKYSCKFEGIIKSEGEQIKVIKDEMNKIDIKNINMFDVYKNMYNDIINHNAGIKPAHVCKLHWFLDRIGLRYGMGKDVINNRIEFDFSKEII